MSNLEAYNAAIACTMQALDTEGTTYDTDEYRFDGGIYDLYDCGNLGNEEVIW